MERGRIAMTVTSLCRDCLREFDTPIDAPRCPDCASPRLLRHDELGELSIAHIDCDAFYASVEKRDNPTICDKPVIVGGGHRGVVSAACYVARLYGVRSAMPMFQALKACPDAVVIRPDMAKYSAVGQQVRGIMNDYTPLVEPLSIDEAFLDLTGTDTLNKGSAARTLALIVKRIETELGVTASIGLSYNKFLAKVASDLDKPRGFAMIGKAEAVSFLAARPPSIIWGVGKALREKLRRDGITSIGHLQRMPESTLVKRYGAIGGRLFHFARGEDNRTVSPSSAPKSISAETTFSDDIYNLDELCRRLWPLCETVSRRLKSRHLLGRTVTLKLKKADFRQVTRSRTLGDPTQIAEIIYRTGVSMLEKESNGPAYRLIGIGMNDILDEDEAGPPDLLHEDLARISKVERAIDTVRAKLGDGAIGKGRQMR
jgi:DNA polymerase-4